MFVVQALRAGFQSALSLVVGLRPATQAIPCDLQALIQSAACVVVTLALLSQIRLENTRRGGLWFSPPEVLKYVKTDRVHAVVCVVLNIAPKLLSVDVGASHYSF